MSDLVLREDFEGGYDNGPLARAEIREGFGKHQIAILDYLLPKNYSTLAPDLTPFTFSWGMTPLGIRTFYGYVNHKEVIDDQSEGNTFVRMFGIGTSRSLNTPNPASWKNVTASYIARTIAEKHGLRALIHKTTKILPFASPGAGSDFAMLNGLASDEGFQFWVDGATLYFLDPGNLITSPDRSVASTYRQDRIAVDTIIGVQSIDGSLAPVAAAPYKQKVFGINDDSSSLIQASSTQQLAEQGLTAPLNTKIYPKTVGSFGEANRVSAIAAKTGTWSSLQVVTVGDGKARVGSLVDLEGVALNPDYSGVWLTQDLLHVLSGDPQTKRWTYTAQMELVRNQKNQVYFSAFSTLKDALSEVPAVLRSGQWESQTLESVYV